MTEEEYSLLLHLPDATKIDEDSEEFQEVIKNFYSTIQEYHSKIRIIQVGKEQNPSLLVNLVFLGLQICVVPVSRWKNS